jgi:hypothetical protein
MSTEQSYPLQWPVGRSRTPAYKRKSDPFHMPSGKIRHDLERELKFMKSTNWVISSNIMIRNDGFPYANQAAPEDTGVALYFTHKDKEICISCDQYRFVDANLRAIGKTIEAIRGIKRWGTEEMMDSAFTGFAALPATVTPPIVRPWHKVLEVSSTASMAVIDAAYKQRLHQVHPDHGGSDEAFIELQHAYSQAKEVRS